MNETQSIEQILNIEPEYQGVNKYLLDINEVVERETEYFFTSADTPIIPRGELIGIKGRAKMGKSQFIYYLTAAVIGGEIGNMKTLRDLTVLIADTEQSDISIKRCIKRSLRSCGLDYDDLPNNINMLYLRPVEVERRADILFKTISVIKPDIVFVDGVRDLIANHNDIVASNECVTALLKICARFRCTIACVLHMNKSKSDTNMRGHLGTELLNKLYTCFEVTKNVAGEFNVFCSDSRDEPCQPICFKLENGAFTSEGLAMDAMTEEESETLEIKEALNEFFRDKDSVSSTELAELLMSLGYTKRTANRRIRELKDANIIKKVGHKLYLQSKLDAEPSQTTLKLDKQESEINNENNS